MSKQLLTKSDLALADIVNGNGILNPDRADKFILKVTEQPTLINLVRVETMRAPKMRVPKIGIGKRIFRAATEGTALTNGQRVKPTFESVELNTVLMKAEIRLTDEQLEDNIEKEGLIDTILDLAANQAALDWEDLLINGSSTFVDAVDADNQAFMRLTDGVLARISSHEVNAASAGINETIFSNALLALPNKYQRNKGNLRFFVTPTIEQKWRLRVSQRQTNLGDSSITGANAVAVQGVQVIPVAVLPNNTALLFDPQNIILGVQRDIKVETERLVGEGAERIVLTCRIAVGIEEEDATVQINNFN